MITEQAVIAAYDAGAKSGRVLAEALKVSERQALRWLNRLYPDRTNKNRNNRNRLTTVEQDRIAVLAQEGVPTTWIAEDLGISRDAVDRHRDQLGIPRAYDYKAVYLAIRWDEHLLNLHREFAP